MEAKLDKCLAEKIEEKLKYKAKIEELQAAHAQLGGSYCMRTLALKEARIEELEIELDIC